MSARMESSRQILPACLAALGLLVALLLASGCRIDEGQLIGVWSGQSADTTYTFDLQPDGKGRVKVVSAGGKVDYPCAWSLEGERLWLRGDRGRTANFRIMEQSDDEMVVRVANGLGGTCRMRRETAN